MKKMIFLVCALFFVLTGFNQQERIVEQGNVEILGSVADVGHVPVIMKHLKDCQVNEGGIAVFLAHFEPQDDPNIRVVWYRNGKPIVTGVRIKTYKDGGCVTLVIDDVMVGDSGVYSVKIYNLLGEAKSEAILIVTD
ncbi:MULTISPECIES: immunoglobulin domain-containing protein [Butyricimonas]|uniref:immunoglobulin domain-containing protein n=1 Tax=Butyricimonas TaxID=574697 RepID=UPI001D0877E7|nr:MULTISPECIES: immunoglobulin domain-containing protein [Butyricimonas]MCB6974105.1 immunoglobulin domain-containing protein [Butyricimonas synergistica]MCG4520833.1 immunoglobulin domain-containing protein [Butyricimonas sp. DFI.6.44]